VKNNIDEWFKVERKKVLHIINYYKLTNNANFETNEMFSDVYLHAINNLSIINSISKLEQIVYNYIKKNSQWNSAIKRGYVSRVGQLKSYITDETFDFDYFECSEDEDLLDKIDLELKIDILYKFKNSIADPVKRIYMTKWINFLHDGIKPSTRLLAKEFNIKHHMAASMSKELLLELNNFLIENNYKKKE
jgi:hypothetical protein